MKGGASASRTGTPRRPAEYGEIPLPSISTHPILSKVLTTHDVTWMRRDSFCRDQYVTEQPEEVPSMPVKTRIFQIEPPKQHSGFEKFNFEEGLWDE